MKIVRIIGGLGNQMFQYALYLSLKERFPDEDIKVDCSYFKTYHVHSGLELTRVFGIELPQATYSELLRVTWPVSNFKLSRVIRKLLPPRKTECLEFADRTFNAGVFEAGDKYYDGYWLDSRYFPSNKNIFRQVFHFNIPLSAKNQSLLEKIRYQDQSVSIHVRRGDYLKVKDFIGLCGIEYYQSAIKNIMTQISDVSFYIFSDDICWCKTHLAPLIHGEAHYIDWNTGSNSPIDMLLMSACRHNIIANSTFSWWAAYLKEKDGLVYAPEKWNNSILNRKIQLPEWILL